MTPRGSRRGRGRSADGPGVPAHRRWVSAAGVELTDRVPSALRRRWVDLGWCPDLDLYRLFARHARANPDREAVVDAAGTLRFAELDDAVRRTATVLAAAGLGPGDVVALRLPDDRDAVTAELAVAAVGAVSLPYPPGRGDADTVSLLGRARAAGAVLDAPPADRVRAALPHLRTVLTGAGLRAAADAVGDPRWSPPPIDPEAPARIMVTSGSEAEPTMIAYAHNAIGGGRANYVRALHGGDGPMRNLVLVPLGSSMGSCGLVTVAALGATLVLTGRFDAGSALRALTRHRPTHVFGVPTMLRRIADRPPEPGEDTSGLRALVSSGAALPPGTADACVRRFGRPVITVYGSADGVNCHTARDATGTGLPDPAVADIAVHDERTGDPLPPGEPGEIRALGPMTPLCHVAAPGPDARYRTSDGWVRTGDRGTLDGRGRLHVLGRLRHVVVRGGYNISPAEVERELGTHPGIADVACVPVPDADLGERLCACVSPVPGAPPIGLRDLTAFLRDDRGLDRRKLPEALVVLPELPLGPTGKPCRHTLAAVAADRHREGQ